MYMYEFYVKMNRALGYCLHMYSIVLCFYQKEFMYLVMSLLLF